MKTAAVVATLLASACASSTGAGDVGDKAGNQPPSTTLTLVTSEQLGRPGADTVERFVAAVDELSGGRVVITPTFDHPSDQPPNLDQVNVQALRAGEFDLTLVPARAWHFEGVQTLEPLQLPFLVETDAQADRVAADTGLATALLAGLASIDITGLGLFPEGVRHLVRLDGAPIDPTGNLDGLTVRAPAGDTTSAVLKGLGADVVYLNSGDLSDAVTSKRVAVAETSLTLSSSLPAIGRPSVLLNMVLYTKFNVLAISDAVVARLDVRTLAVLRDAAAAALDKTIAERPREPDALTQACAIGIGTVRASEAQLQAMRERLKPVSDQIITAAGVQSLVKRVSATAGEGSEPVLSDCPATEPSDTVLPSDVAALKPFAGDLPDGTYRFEVHTDIILASYPNFPKSKLAGYSGVYTAVLNGGRLTLEGVINDGQTWRNTTIYEVDGNNVTVALASGFDFYTPMAVHWRWAVA
ncbi:MAG: hypothetical protein ABJD24_13475, partial [Acidimicrobiales bacterium]